MNAPGDDSPRSGSNGSKEITEYLLSGLARITTPKPGGAALPFSCAEGVVTVGPQRVAVAAILERTDPVHGRSLLAFASR
jgi:hypothetical protein